MKNLILILIALMATTAFAASDEPFKVGVGKWGNINSVKVLDKNDNPILTLLPVTEDADNSFASMKDDIYTCLLRVGKFTSTGTGTDTRAVFKVLSCK